MSLFENVATAIALSETAQRQKARSKAHDLARHCDWLRLVLQHHEQIEQAFAPLRDAASPRSRRMAERALAGLLTAHAIAEEAVLYPALAKGGQRAHAIAAYTEQNQAKVQMAALESLDPMSPHYLDALAELEQAIARHLHEEESSWYPALARTVDAATQARLSARYLQEFDRYMDGVSLTG